MEIDLATLESLAEELMPVPDIAIFLGVPEPDLREAAHEFLCGLQSVGFCVGVCCCH